MIGHKFGVSRLRPSPPQAKPAQETSVHIKATSVTPVQSSSVQFSSIQCQLGSASHQWQWSRLSQWIADQAVSQEEAASASASAAAVEAGA
mmetsp:Transcript_71191/g.148886  ORF Transcript_71191/g.148886 Transcript_71191/m.148886 type:complete len:91 (+) Transcript_71191:196-468(+)|eukprot:CAMPEP_0206584864 /NCGR_PEP_ID=MMETSP0325_2-20121206/36030_1 /ASSEMBLY_ACC=CAM_ASM_000347 /TAXON_ID=2866 /ORGANISM="Crypthecodinium cohnii, Strain Seligo" /LENGTH=90 /DNA_ID=CAMNT_0054092211 /DNA_START=217 /DNA_END=489 /DNA_ORIENTATION=-